MICTMFRDISSKLSNLDLAVKLSLETRKQHLTLRWLKSIHHVGNCSQDGGFRKQNKLLVEKPTLKRRRKKNVKSTSFVNVKKKKKTYSS